MSTRSRQAWQLALALTDRTGVRVDIEWHGADGWRVRWADGPTGSTMAAHAAEVTGRFPAFDVDALRYDRGSTDLAEAIALLRVLTARPGLAPHVTPRTAEDAHRDTEHPETADEPTRRRARALLSLGDGGPDYLSLAVLQQLAERGRDNGLGGITAWLDEAAAAPTGAAAAVDLRAARASRRGRRP